MIRGQKRVVAVDLRSMGRVSDFFKSIILSEVPLGGTESSDR